MHHAKIRLRNPEGADADGEMIVLAAGIEWQEVAYLEPTECEHQSTMCRECIPSWALDYEIQRPNLT